MVSQWQIINKNYKNMDGYKRVAWPPASEERVVREFTPQPTSAHYPVSGQQQQQQQPAQQHQPQHLQQQQQQQQPPHYQQQQQPSAAPANQGPIYNNVNRAGRHNSPNPNQQQQFVPQAYQQSPIPQQPQQQQQQHYEPPQQPIRYTQAQFNRQPSREPAGPPHVQHVNEPFGQQQQLPHQQPAQQQQPLHYSHEQQYPQQQQHEPSSPSGWKSIRAPLPKAHSDFYASPVGGENAEPFYPSYGQQQQHQQPTQQYRATSYDQYQQQPQQYPAHQGSQPPYSQQPYYQTQPQQQPSWAHNQPTQRYQPPQAPYQQAPIQQQQQYQAPPPSNYQSQPYHQQLYQAPPQQQQPPQQYSSVPQTNQYNSYSQPQHQQQSVGQDQPDHRALVQQQQAQPLPQDYRGGSPGIITLRKEAPVTQRPSPVYNAQPAAVSFQGGNNMRGDLKWPPPEYKEAAAKENEERRKLALGPVCRPRKVQRDYTTFFAKNALNCYYPSYKVPPGTQHMLE